jgi:hypothetical protein
VKGGLETCPTEEAVLLVASFGDPAAADYAAFACRRAPAQVALVGDACTCRHVEAPARLYPLGGPPEFTFRFTSSDRVAAAVVFLPPRLTDAHRAALDDLLALAAERRAESVTLVSSARVHLDDRNAAEVEAYAYDRARDLRARTVIVRAGHVLSRHSRTAAVLRFFGACYPLVPQRLRSCCVAGDELFEMIETVRQAPRTRRLYTLLGPNRPWRELLAEQRSRGPVGVCFTVICAVLSLLLVGHLAALVFDLLTRLRPSLRAWNYDTLRPRSLRELIALANPYNHRYVKVVGYNNGVTHFGHRYPDRTVVSTVRCDRVARAGADAIRTDCGATVRKALDFLAASGQELYVIPNYSYVCLGTAFFVPIHGSASDFSTVAETIIGAVFYDPASDRVTAATRDEPPFREHLYNPKSNVLLLRLCLRVKSKSRYYVRKQELEGPTTDELLHVLHDKRAANVEVRKSRAGDSKVSLYQYYNDRGDTNSPVLELPRDRLGRMWDRLEENPVTSFLMHALTRHFAWHVELFFTDEEFRTFWATHRGLPLRKIQLRHIRRDGFPHSPFHEHDCVSADLFMFRRHRRRFEAYLRQTFAVVRSNPGKHSR